jgi:hypothetical protein
MASFGYGAGGPGWAPIRLYLSVERGEGKSTDQTKNSFVIAAAGTAPRLWVCPSRHLVVEVGMVLATFWTAPLERLGALGPTADKDRDPHLLRAGVEDFGAGEDGEVGGKGARRRLELGPHREAGEGVPHQFGHHHCDANIRPNTVSDMANGAKPKPGAVAELPLLGSNQDSPDPEGPQ